MRTGIILFIILPALFVAGLLLIPAGYFLQRWRDKKAGRDGVRYVLLRRPGFPVLGARVPPEHELEVVEWLRER